MRDLTPNFEAEVVKPVTQRIYLVETHLETRDTREEFSWYMTDAYKSITYDGNTYRAYGDLLSFSGLEEVLSLEVSTLTATISNISREQVSSYLSMYYVGRPVVIYQAYMGMTDDTIGDKVVEIFRGGLDTPVLNENPESGTSTMSITAGSRFIDFDRYTYRRTNNESQQKLHPGDKGMEFASKIIDFNWGRSS